MKKAALILFSLIFLTSCADDVQSNNPAMQGSINNEFWKSTNTVATKTGGGGLTIKGSSKLGDLTLKINSTNVGTYALGTSDQTIFADYFDPKSPQGEQNFVTSVILGSPNSVSIENGGTGYTAGSYPTVSTSSGAGLVVNVTVDAAGTITEALITDSGNDYTNGEIVTVTGGNGNATLKVGDVSLTNGEIEITEYDGTTVTGKFNFTAINAVDKTINFKNGIFYKIPVN
jgi:hypothetical protein